MRKQGKNTRGFTDKSVTSVTELFATDDTHFSETHVTPNRVIRKRQSKPSKPRARKCKICLEKFTPKVGHGRFCSDACRQKHYRQQHAGESKVNPEPVVEVLYCAHCNDPFWGSPTTGTVYCSPAHKSAAYRARRDGAVDALMGDLAMTREEALDVVELRGMADTTKYLHQRGYTWSGQLRAWVFAPT